MEQNKIKLDRERLSVDRELELRRLALQERKVRLKERAASIIYQEENTIPQGLEGWSNSSSDLDQNHHRRGSTCTSGNSFN